MVDREARVVVVPPSRDKGQGWAVVVFKTPASSGQVNSSHVEGLMQRVILFLKGSTHIYTTRIRTPSVILVALGLVGLSTSV